MTSNPPLVVQSEPLRGSELTQAILSGSVSAGWAAPLPADIGAWRARVAAARERVKPGWLDAIAPAIAAKGAAAERLRRAAERGVVVTAGQQPGLFGGPIYTWSKAMSALALADALEAALDIPVAPVFWAATDDADFAESTTTWIAMPGGAVELSLDRTAPDGTVMAVTPLGNVGPALRVLEEAAGSAAYGESLIAVREAYVRPGESPTVGDAYVALLRRLFEPLGIAVLDAAHDAVRTQIFPILRRALTEAAAVDLTLRARDAELRAAGYEPQVTLVPDLSLVFNYYPGSGTRSRIPLSSAARVAREAAPGELSQSVLIRPLVEQEILPTVAYVAGPAELAYFVQSAAVAVALGRPQPLAVPRWSGRIVEPHVARGLARYGLTIEALRDPHAAESRFLHDHLPQSVQQALDALGASIDAGFKALMTADGASLAAPAVVESARIAMHQRLQQLEQRYRAGARAQHQTALAEIATLRGALFPGGVPQERRLNLIPILARHGPTVVEAMRARAAAHAATLVGESAAR